MKTCTKCGEMMPLTEFYNSKASKDGKKPSCKKCMYKYGINYRSNNKEKIKEYKSTYRHIHKEEIKINSKRHNRNYYINNKEKVNTTNKEWRKNNKEEIKATIENWRNNNKEKVKASRKNWIKNNPEYMKRCSAKRKRNLGFIPLNKKDKGLVGHHIDKQHVVYIPKEIHMSIPHKQTDKKSMEKINELTLNWMLGVKNC